MSAGFESIFRSDLFDGQVIFVTGGGTGIGRCTAHELASLGAHVVIGARRPQPLAETAAEIAATGGRCDTLTLDVRDAEAVDLAVAQVVERFGRLDGLVHNAGGQFMAPAANISANGWRTVIDLNLNSSFLLASAAHRHWMAEHGGAIVHMLADIWTGYPGMVHMSAARAGIENMTRTLALEWGAAGVRINSVAPGTILSSGMLTYPEPVQQGTAKQGREVALGRLGTESEVSAAIAFLLSPAAAYITGETLRIDGGAQFQKVRLLPIGGKPAPRWDGFHLKRDFSGTPFAEDPE